MTKELQGADAAGSIDADQLAHAAPTHTPGPWGWYDDQLHNVAAYEAYSRAFDDARDSRGDVCGSDVAEHSTPIVETDSGVYGPRGADRHLIAAAPELLAALKEVSFWLKEQRDYQLNNAYPEEYAAVALAEAAIAKAEGRQ